MTFGGDKPPDEECRKEAHIIKQTGMWGHFISGKEGNKQALNANVDNDSTCFKV
jgi:hypothetical protein